MAVFDQIESVKDTDSFVLFLKHKHLFILITEHRFIQMN